MCIRAAGPVKSLTCPASNSDVRRASGGLAFRHDVIVAIVKTRT